MAPRPEIYAKNQKGKTIINPDYNAYLRDLIGMTPEEMREWHCLGVHLTDEKIGQIVGFNSARAFIFSPIGENGNGEHD